MEVWVLIQTYKFESGSIGCMCDVFGNLDSAKDAMKKAIKEARKNMKDVDVDKDYANRDIEYYMYENGYYDGYIDMVIYKKEVK